MANSFISSRRRWCASGAAGLSSVVGAALLPSIARAQNWPSQPIRIVLPFAPGGTSDLVARLMAERLGQAFNQSVIVEPKPGANGIIASTFVARSNPDGHTVLFASAAHASNASLYPKLPYDSTRDFVPVAQVVPPGPMVIAVNASVPARNLREWIELAKAKPGELTYGSAGIGNTLHLAGEMLSQSAAVKMLHVPYRGAGPALNDLVAGQINMMFNSALAVAPFVKEGRLRVLAQTGAKRSPNLPDVATVQEQGLAGFEVTGWFGLFAPAKTPSDTILRINRECNRVMALPEMREKLALLGNPEPSTLPPEGFAIFVRQETERYAGVIRGAGLSLETPS